MPRLGCLHICVLIVACAATLTGESFAQETTAGKIKRRQELSYDDLRKQLQDPVPELGFDQMGRHQQPSANLVYTPIDNIKKLPEGKRPGLPLNFGRLQYEQWALSLNQKEKWAALPWRSKDDAELNLESAKRLQVLSLNLRRLMRESVPSSTNPRPDPAKLEAAMAAAKGLEWDQPEAIPTLMQMLQVEDNRIRILLIDMLSRIPGKDASVALAQRAVFDLAPDVRERAIRALAQRPHKEYQQVLLESLRSPWPPAADHAAEALTGLQMKDVQPQLIEMLKQPDPKLPYEAELNGAKTPVMREMVRVNHLCNCALCHALSASKDDPVRGRVPTPGQEMREPYYAETTGLFVRADITYLRQDFSLFQPVASPIKWAGQQRFDYLVRVRKATPAEARLLDALPSSKKAADTFPQREALLFALRELSGRDLGNRPEDWQQLLSPIRKEPSPKQ